MKNQDCTEQIRLNRAIAASGACSRRKADELILQGRVEVNGKLATDLATRVTPLDKLSIDGTPLEAAQTKLYLMLNKPIEVVCTVRDPQNRTTVLDILPADIRKTRVYPVGRLDYFSEGLLILTNDGQIAQKLAHPSHQHPKVYEVLVKGDVTSDQLEELRHGMTLSDGTKLAPVEASVTKMKNGTSLLRLILRQGINRQIRKMCAQMGLVILRLKRVSQGPLKLGQLKPGAWRKLTPSEIHALASL